MGKQEYSFLEKNKIIFWTYSLARDSRDSRKIL